MELKRPFFDDILAADDEGDALWGIRGGGGCCAGTGGLVHRGTLALPFGTMSTSTTVIVILVLKTSISDLFLLRQCSWLWCGAHTVGSTCTFEALV